MCHPNPTKQRRAGESRAASRPRGAVWGTWGWSARWRRARGTLGRSLTVSRRGALRLTSEATWRAPSAASSWLGRRGPHRRRLALSALCLALLCAVTGCVSDPPSLVVADLGDHDVQVGIPFALPLQALRSRGVVRWSLQQGPADMVVLDVDGLPHLVWVATAFDLALVMPGEPRAPGPTQDLRVQACDEASRCTTTQGTVRAVPTPAPVSPTGHDG